MRALRDEVIIRIGREPEVSAGGIILIEGEMPLGPIPGEVTAVGPDADPDIRVGQTVYYRGSAESRAFEHLGVKYARVKGEDIHAVVEAEAGGTRRKKARGELNR